MDRINRLIVGMTDYFRGDPKRIQHFIKVHSFAKLIADGENADDISKYRLEAAAVVHDIGIKPAEEKYGKGHCGGKLQEQLGPEPARKMLTELGFDEDTVDKVCRLVACHHTYDGVNCLEWQILLEADFLVNAYEDDLSKEAILNFRDKVFKTEAGTKLLNDMFGLKA